MALTTPSGQSEFQAYRDPDADPPAVVVTVGKTELRYQLRALDDLATMLKARGDWMPLGSADEQKPAAEGTVEAWARSADNPVGGWYGLKKGLRGRFANYVPPVMSQLGLAEVEDKPTTECGRADGGCQSRRPDGEAEEIRCAGERYFLDLESEEIGRAGERYFLDLGQLSRSSR